MGRYFWLKLRTSFFDSDEIRAMESQENGAEYILFWLKLLSKAITQEQPGRLRFRETIPYTDSLLSSVLKTDIDIVRSAMKLFQSLGMVQVVEDGTIWVEQAERLVGSESTSAERMRRLRERQKALPSHCDKSDTHSDIESYSNSISSCSSVQEYPAAFETWWTAYPRKTEKKAALAKWKATLKKGASQVDLLTAVQAYAAACNADGRESKYIKHPATFLGSAEPWREYIGTNGQGDAVPTAEEAAAALFGRG